MSKHTPVRSCVICRERFSKRELTRFVYAENTERIEAEKTGYVRDDKQILPGRGVYLCSKKNCLERGRKKLSITVGD